MRGTRVLLVATSGLVVVAFAGLILFDGAVRAGAASDDWIGVLSVAVGAGSIAAAAVSFIHATRERRDGVLWGVTALLFPFAAPLVLAALRSRRAPVIRGSSLAAVLSDTWVCVCGVIRAGRQEGDVCPGCGKPLLRFHRAAPNRNCDGCGALFSDDEVSTQDCVGEVFARKGFHCNQCGRELCLRCIPSDAAGSPTFRCSCGGTVAIRI